MPAFEYKEFDGVVVSAGNSKSFRIPPLVARDYSEPEGMIIFIAQQTKPTNSILKFVHSVLVSLGWMESVKKEKYLVSSDYWTPLSVNSDISALKAVCRDTEWFSKSSQCKF